MLKALLSVVTVVAVLVTIIAVPLRACSCNRARRAAVEAFDRAQDMSSEWTRRQLAQNAASPLNECIASNPADWRAQFFLGRLLEVLGQKRDAERMYEAAISLQGRPELYYSLSLLQFERGDIVAAGRNIERAAMFNIIYAMESDAAVNAELWRKWDERQKSLTRPAP